MAEISTPKRQNARACVADAAEAAGMVRERCDFAMVTHPGQVRRVNEDACAALPEMGAFVVCDGIGGAAAGEVASQLAVDAFLEALRQPRRRRVRRIASDEAVLSEGAADNALTAYPESHPRSRLCEAVRAANQAIFRHARKAQGLRGMGTTLVGALYEKAEARLWLAHVGDSRCYRLRGGALELLTEDHSLVEEQVRAGTLSRVEAEASPIRNIITRSVGCEPEVEAEIAEHVVLPGDVYLLATDGLTREISEARMAELLPGVFGAAEDEGLRQAKLEAACQALVDAANAEGGRDNITVLLIGCS